MAKTKSFLKRDIEKYFMVGYKTYKPVFKERIKFYLTHFGFHCVAIYRLGQYSFTLWKKNKLLGFFPFLTWRFLDFFMTFFHAVTIDINAKIGDRFYIGHVGTIFIGPTTIGDNFCIHHNVTIGRDYSPGAEGVPVFGNNVWIGAGSVISGNYKIGNNVTIMTGSILSRDVPDNCLVGGNPARILSTTYDNSTLKNFFPDNR